MKNNLLFFKVIPRQAIWGGNRVRKYFGYDVPDTTGQVWAFSAQADGETICQNGSFKGLGLKKLWEDYPELFESKNKSFPYIISLVAPVDNLSVQVHPTDTVAKKLGYENGKNEAWVLLKTESKTSLIYGSKIPISDLLKGIKSQDFNNIFNSQDTKQGDFFYIPAGTIHGLGKGNIAYEIQQSTDLTFRVYDYERREKDGRARKLDIPDAIESIKNSNPQNNTTLNFVHPKARDLINNKNVSVREYINNESFVITNITVKGRFELSKQGYWLTTVSEGSGKLNGAKIQFSDNFIVPATTDKVILEGNFTLMITSEKRTIVEGS